MKSYQDINVHNINSLPRSLKLPLGCNRSNFRYTGWGWHNFDSGIECIRGVVENRLSDLASCATQEEDEDTAVVVIVFMFFEFNVDIDGVVKLFTNRLSNERMIMIDKRGEFAISVM